SGVPYRLEEDEKCPHIMNSKGLCRISHIKEIVDSGVIDSLKTEGRTKGEYYAACTARAYKMAIDDAMDDKFDEQIYENEINTLKNSVLTDGYLVHRTYERTDKQNHDRSLEEVTHQVNAIREDGDFFKCQSKIFPGNSYEIVATTGY
ncbi:peptidase U32 family protein, partial [Campylobacter concisus]|uniref:peptidase U32 family protein n=1 Tax=Campylobacter concisus TaxID=199 RepID=UPI0015E1A9D2